ncbi:MAG: DUF3558 domain-containing protein [Actinophytocola sp.]|uniref:DUF3558 domain-containing protein n=1 Tax=Actinophytocola sp. TaxID=1872138 RepID=UPI001324BFC0|nr:DUF3558 domain-containing protein [Actinophytocola sp.]MPZ84081.1 DUF3558 domain-containing protein [Actinophytocola sp.]
MNARAYAVVVVCVAALGPAGCTTSDAGTPTPGPDSSESSAPTSTGPSEPSSEQDTFGAPRVENPLDASRFLVDPCAVLTPAQLAPFGVSQPGEGDTDSEIAKTVGPLCIWHADPEVDSTISVAWQSGNKHGLADLYRMRDEWEYFLETMVGGYPAVFNDSIDNRDGGDCTISVGVSDTLTFDASETGVLDADGACARAEQVAKAAVVTMRGNR